MQKTRLQNAIITRQRAPLHGSAVIEAHYRYDANLVTQARRDGAVFLGLHIRGALCDVAQMGGWPIGLTLENIREVVALHHQCRSDLGS